MLARINPSGTHIHKGKLKVRVDIYPDATSKTFAMHHVDKYDREPTEEERADKNLPAKIGTHKEDNPCLCHFIVIDEDMTRTQLSNLVMVTFNKTAVDELDDALSKNDRSKVSQVMRPKKGIAGLVKQGNIEDVNARFKDLEVTVGVN